MNIFFFILIVLSVLLETSTVPVTITVAMVTAISLVLGNGATGIVFFGGLLLDLFALRPLGISSLYFLTLCLLAGRYQRKIFVGNTFYTVVFLLAAIAGYHLLFLHHIDVQSLIISATVALIFLVLINRLFPHHGGPSTKLRV